MKVFSVEIVAGVVTYDFFGHEKSKKAFFAGRSLPVVEKIKVRGWPFRVIHLVMGDPENGSGWAFVR